MDNQSLFVYYEPDPAKKDYAWFDLAITTLRRDLRPIVNPNDDVYRKELLDGRQSMQRVIESFDDVNFKKTVKFKPLGIMNAFVNTVIEEVKQTPPRAEVKAVDPSAMTVKKEELNKLKYRKILERDRSELQGRVGFGPYKLPTSSFDSNIEEFDKMGLDETDPEDVNFFDKTYHRIDFEIAAQSLINGVLKLSKFNETHIEKYVRDAMASNVVCGQTYVNRITGQICNDYIYPSEYYFIPSDTEDGRDDIAKGWFRSVTINEFLARVGNQFVWERDWPYLIWAINYCNNTKYTGFVRNGATYDCCGNPQLTECCGLDSTSTKESNCCEWVMAFRYKVYMGYTEWLVPEVTASYLSSKKDKAQFSEVPVNYRFKNKKQREEYEHESWYQWQLYYGYYLATTTTSQYIFDFGKVYHQLLEGANDEYARYTCWSYRNPGKPAAEIAEPFIEMANFTFYRMLWAIYKAKPEEDQFLINELLEIAKGVQRQFSQQGTNSTVPSLDNILNNVIQYQRQKAIRIRAYPRIDGREIGQLPPLKNEHSGLDPIAVSMQAIIMWAQQMIATQIGINPMRIGANPPSRESFKSEQQTIQASDASTSYIYRMIQYIKEHMATVSMLYGQDVIKFKESIPYKWIETLIGEDQMVSLQTLDKVAAHRFSIFVEDMNDTMDKQEIKQAAAIALQEKQITFDQWFIVTQTTDFKRAAQLLSFLQRKADKKKRMQELQDQKIAQTQNENLHNMKMAELQFDRETRWGVADRQAQGSVESAKIQADGRVEVKQLQNQAEAPKQQAKAQAETEVERNKKELENQQPFKV